MISSKRGHIVTVGSVTGLLGTYACTDYSATKFACVGFHESLFSELKVHGHDYVNLTLVCPYYIATGMFSGVKPRLMPMLELNSTPVIRRTRATRRPLWGRRR